MPIRAIFDSTPEKAAVLSKDTGKIWYDKMVGGIRPVTKENGLPEGAGFGFEIDTFVLDTGAYLPWCVFPSFPSHASGSHHHDLSPPNINDRLQAECLKAGITFRRKILTDIKEPFQWFPSARAIFNCTALGSYHLLGVEDHALYPTLGQVMLVESPAVPIGKMYFRSPARTHSDTTYVFPRGDNRGVILGGCRIDGVWEGKVEEERAEDIKRRCCELCPALGKPEDLKVIKHGLGLRPSRKGGARIQKEVIGGRTVVHNYGAGGAGYQASWGMAKEAVNLLLQVAKL